MSKDNTNQADTGGADARELLLARAVRELPREVEPERNLWPAIERRIGELPRSSTDTGAGRFARHLMPMAVAASLLLAASALLLTLAEVPWSGRVSDQAGPAVVVAQPRAGGELLPVMLPGLDALQDEFLVARTSLYQRFEARRGDMDPAVEAEIRRNLKLMERARQDIEMLLARNSESQRLLLRLMRVQQQELDLLRADYLDFNLDPGAAETTVF